ncbi:MAG: hypothetical protein QM811_08320 [Pirellulales bacterium]
MRSNNAWLATPAPGNGCALAGAWDMLDELPRSTVDENFAKTTVAMVAVAAKQDVEKLKHSEPRRRNARKMWIAFGGVVAAALGFFMVKYAWPDPNRRLLNDLGLIENWRMYQDVGGVDFLRDLDKAGLFWTEGAESVEATLPMVPVSLTDRKIYLEQLSDNQLEVLSHREADLDRLPAAEIVKLRKLDQDLRTSDDSARLSSILLNYHNWLNARSPVEIVEIRQAEPAKRLERIRALQGKDESEWVKKYGFPSYMAEDFRRIHAWLSDAALAHAAEIEANATDAKKALLAKSSPENRKRILLGMWFDQEMAKRRAEELAAMTDEERRNFEHMPQSRQRFHMMQTMRKVPFAERKLPLPLTDAEIQDLEKRLSANAQKILAEFAPKSGAAADDSGQSGSRTTDETVRMDRRVGSLRVLLRGFIGDKELREYFDALPDDVRKEMALLSPEDLRREVRSRYIYDHVGGIGFGRGGPGGPEGPGGWNGEPRGDGSRGEGRGGDGRGNDGRPNGGPPRPNDGGDGRPRNGFEGRGPNDRGPREPGQAGNGGGDRGPNGEGKRRGPSNGPDDAKPGPRPSEPLPIAPVPMN